VISGDEDEESEEDGVGGLHGMKKLSGMGTFSIKSKQNVFEADHSFHPDEHNSWFHSNRNMSMRNIPKSKSVAAERTMHESVADERPARSRATSKDRESLKELPVKCKGFEAHKNDSARCMNCRLAKELHHTGSQWGAET
jgi:hypothetical protein